MKIDVHIICYNESRILAYTIRHYLLFCSRLVIHDMGSTDGSQNIARAAGAGVIQHDGRGEFNDMQNKTLKQSCWKGSRADWCIVVDTDELLRFPTGPEATLASYTAQGLSVIKPIGYDMVSDVYPTTSGQIYDEVKMGARDDFWGAKPCLFSPKLVQSIEFSAGAHTCTALLENRRKLVVNQQTPPSSPPVHLLHFHHIAPITEIAMKYDVTRARYSELNKKFGWGTREPGMKHAQDKRRGIMEKLERVLP